MNSSVGRFRLEEVDGKKYLVPHIESVGEPSINSPSPYICPWLRRRLAENRVLEKPGQEEPRLMPFGEILFSPVFREHILSSDYYKWQRLEDIIDDHYAVPLFWCKNKEDVYREDVFRVDDYCYMCIQHLKIGTDYYFCVKCDRISHKECVESPPEIKHPNHPNHPLKLSILDDYLEQYLECARCRSRETGRSIYYCAVCTLAMHITCAFKSIPFVIEKTKRHDHPLTFFTRKDHLRCNICGLINHNHGTYICHNYKCDFVVHQECADFPSVIRISRHHHRVSFTSSLPPKKWICGVCRKSVDGDYGAYICNKCDGYVVHSKCALRKYIWDGEELEKIPEDDDIEEVLDPFERISDGLILHFLHDHHLKSETSGEVYDESKICHGCVLPIYEGEFYSCMECDFILHDSCANAPRKKRHPLHPHPLTLKLASEDYCFTCCACYCDCTGFVYESVYERGGDTYLFQFDVRCGSISEPFAYQGHEHPLFLALDPEEEHSCQVCQNNQILINCIECDFIICLTCVTVPYMAKYKHDDHFLTLVHGEETKEPDWCQVCEKLLISSNEEDKRFYECKQCCTTLHIKCLLGKTPYIKPGHTIDGNIQVVANNSVSRPLCNGCDTQCVDKIVFHLVIRGLNYISCCQSCTRVINHVQRSIEIC